MSTKGKRKRKPMTVEAVLDNPASSEPITQASGDREKQSEGRRSHVKQLTLYLPYPVYRQLRELAFHEEKRMHSLLMESLDRLFADRGAPSIAQLTRGD